MRAVRVATVGLLAGALIFSGASLANAEAAQPDGAATATEGDTSSMAGSPDSGTSTASTTPPADTPEPPAPAPVLPSAPEQAAPSAEQPPPPPPAAPAPPETPAAPAETPDAATQPEAPAEADTLTPSSEAPVEVPALRWQVLDSDGAVIPGTTVMLAGPRNAELEDLGNDEQWADAPATAVEDNTGAADYTGLDLDPVPGVFRIEQFVDEETAQADPAAVPVAVVAGSDYRVRAAVADGYVAGDDAEWTTLAVLTDAGAAPQPVTLESIAVASREVSSLAEITPLADSSHADIIVRKRVFAEPSAVTAQPSVNIGSNYASTVGTVFRLYTFTTGSNTPGAPTGYTCTITSGGQCTIVVDQVNNTGANNGKRFWVIEENPVAGSEAALNTYANSELFVGDYTGPSSSRRLVGLTKPLAPNQVLYLPMTSGVNSGSQYTNIASGELPGSNAPSVAEAGSFGAVVNSFNNPVIAARCEATPLRIGIILDQSASIESGQWTTFRNALVQGPDAVLRQLRTAGAAVSILGFGTNVTSGGNGWHYGGAGGPQALPANDSTLENLIPTSRPGGTQNATNWDAALSAMQTANATYDYDMVLFVTDGAPNYILASSAVDGFNVTLRSLEAPIYAANAIKAAGTRVVTVGVGAGASGANVAKNLRAVSGPANGSDYLQGDWDRLKQILNDIVSAATCQIPVDVSKTQLNSDGSTTANAANWGFQAALQPGTTNGVTLVGNASQTTGAGEAGKARWTIRFTQPGGQTAVIKLSETQKTGWVLQSVSCTLNAVPITTTIGDDGVSIVVSGLLPNSGALSCVYTNKQATPASVVVNKNWVIDGETVAQGDQPDGMDAVLTLTPAGQTGTPDWGQTRTGFIVGDSVTIGETTTIDPQLFPGCVLTGSTIAGPGISGTPALPVEGRAVTLASASSTYTVTNTVQCQRLTIIKQVENNFGGQATAADWDDELFAKKGSDPQLVFQSGQEQYVTTGSYVLSETVLDGYTQKSLTCTGGTLTGDSVQINAGAAVTCTFVNEDIAGQVSWTKTDGTDKLAGSEWTLTGPGGSTETVIDCITGDCAGMVDQDPAVGAFLLKDLDWGDYTLVESVAPLGYVLDSTPHDFTVDKTTVGSVIALGAFVNTLGVAPALPLTGGLGADFYSFFGLGVLLLALVLLAIRRLWIRRNDIEMGTR